MKSAPQTLSISDGPNYHTLRYDFKPASVNSEEPAILELTPNGQVTIKAPNVGGSSANYTVFRGQRRPHVKECLLIIDNSTGEMVLQKLTDNIKVKATRTLGAGANNQLNARSDSSSKASNNNSGNNNNNNNNKQTDSLQLSEDSSSSDSDSSSKGFFF